MNITEERKRLKLKNIVENIKEVEAVANFDSDQWKIGNANIKRIDKSISTLNVKIQNDKYLVGIDGKNKGNMLDFLKQNFELNNKNSQNERYTVPSEKIEEVVKYYAGVKKENMEIEFYPSNEGEFKRECSESGKVYYILYKNDRIINSRTRNVNTRWSQTVRNNIQTDTMNGQRINDMQGNIKVRAFASDDFLQDKGTDLEKILFADDFYFAKIQPLWQDFLSCEINDIDDFINEIKTKWKELGKIRYKSIELLNYFEGSKKKALDLLNTMIAIFDTHAAKKDELNPYEDKRAIADSNVRQNDWIFNLLRIKNEQDATPSIQNAVDYIKNPQEVLNIYSEEHRKQIANNLLKKQYLKKEFTKDLIRYFEENNIYHEVKNEINLTTFMTKTLYHPLKDKWHNQDNKQDKESKMSEQLQQTINLFKHKNQIILQGSPGTGKTRFAKEIAYHLILDGFLSGDEVERKKQLKELNNDNSKIGISKNINFSEYLKQGQELKTKSRKASFTIKNPKTRIGNVGIELTSSGLKRSINSENIIARINNEDWSIKGSGLEAYEIGIAEYIYNAIKEEKEIDSEDIKLDRYKLIQFHPAYSYEDFVRGIVATTADGAVSYEVRNKVLAEMAQNADDNPNEKFVLIIDEINRANLAAVLGELIYALEYRGEVVESMYAIDGGDREIILPENLYIIGTMNTADRSVGHIDYAIRRRFAFVDVKTDEAVIPDKAKPLFKEIKKLFDEELSEEFDKDDVMIGHSYFLNDDLAMALEYEIKPILLEYVKDGVLTCNKEAITDLNVD